MGREKGLSGLQSFDLTSRGAAARPEAGDCLDDCPALGSVALGAAYFTGRANGLSGEHSVDLVSSGIEFLHSVPRLQ